jgi:hypothetical protein
MQAPLGVSTLDALLTPVIGVTVAIIAWLQWRTNEGNRKQQLFDRRWAFL